MAALCFLTVQRARRAVLPLEEGSAAGPLPTYIGNKEGRSQGRGLHQDPPGLHSHSPVTRGVLVHRLMPAEPGPRALQRDALPLLLQLLLHGL